MMIGSLPSVTPSPSVSGSPAEASLATPSCMIVTPVVLAETLIAVV